MDVYAIAPVIGLCIAFPAIALFVYAIYRRKDQPPTDTQSPPGPPNGDWTVARRNARIMWWTVGGWLAFMVIVAIVMVVLFR
jgi:hypothetical protein